MAINWGLYNKRLTINGSSERERNLNSLQSSISNALPNSLSYKTVKINYIDRNIEFVKTEKSNVKKIHSLPSETFKTGDYVTYGTITYLITETDSDNEIYTSGKMEEINFVIKFQHPTTGAILSYPCITSSTRLGQEENKVMTLGDNQKSITLPYNQTTALLANSDTKTWRFFVDKHPTKPRPYELVSVDNTSHDGLIELIVKEDQLQADDNINLGVCDYWLPLVEPNPVDPTVPQVVVSISSDAINNEIKLGLTYHFTATFKNELGATITNTHPKYTIDNIYNGKVLLVDNNNGTATVKVNDDLNLIGKQFTLHCVDMISGFSSSILFTIVSLW